MTNLRMLCCTALLLLAGTTALTALPPRAEGHYRHYGGGGAWFFRGFTTGNSSGEGRVDPITVFFYKGGRITLNRISNHIGAHANLEDRGCAGSEQYLEFLHYSGTRTPGGHANDVDDVDLVREDGCDNRRHIRIWDDLEHDQNTSLHRAKDWAPGAVHLDKRPEGGGDHIVGENWERSERWLSRQMLSHCRIRNWRMLPGSGRDYQGRASDGYVSLIALSHTYSPGRCPSNP